MSNFFDEAEAELATQAAPKSSSFFDEAEAELVQPASPVAEKWSLMRELSRPGAAVRNMFQNDPAKFDESLVQGWKNPDAVGSLTQVIPSPNPAWPEPVKEAALWGKAALGVTADVAADPLTWAGVPGAGIAGKAIGQGMVRAAERGLPVLGDAAQWAGREMPNFVGQKFASAVDPRTIAYDIARKRTAVEAAKRLSPTPNPVYNPWFEIGRNPDIAHNPWPGIKQVAVSRPSTGISVNIPETVQPQSTGISVNVPQGPRELPVRPPVMGANNQMELNFGSSMEGRPSNAFPFPEKQPNLQQLPRTSPKWQRQEAKRTFQREPDAPQPELDFQKQAPWAVERPVQGPSLEGGAQTLRPVQGPQNLIEQSATPPKSFAEELAARTEAERVTKLAAMRKAEQEAALRVTQQRQAQVAKKAREPQDPAVAARLKRQVEEARRMKERPVEELPLDEDPITIEPVRSKADRVAEDIQKNMESLEAEPTYYANDPEIRPAVEALQRQIMKAQDAGDKAAEAVARGKMDQLITDDGDILPNAKENLKRLLEAARKNTPTNKTKTYPSAMEDLQMILRSKLKEKRGSTGGGSVRPEVQEAMDRLTGAHADALAAHLKTPGGTVAKYVATHFPEATQGQKKALVSVLQSSRPKVGNLYTDTMSPELRAALKENPQVATRPVTPDAAVRAKVGTQGASTAADDLAGMDIAETSAALRHAEQMAEKLVELARGNPAKAERYMSEAVDYLRKMSKIRKLFGTGLRHVGQTGKSADFLNQLEAAANRGEFKGEAEQLVRETIAQGRKMHPTVMSMIDRGIQEYGINMMLYNTDTSMRNVIGGAIGTMLNPIERAGNAVGTAALRAVGVPEHKLGAATEFEEVIPSAIAGIKSIPRAIKSGAKFFVHETSKGVADNYAIQAKGLRRAVRSGDMTRKDALEKIKGLQAKKREYKEDFSTQEDLSSLGIRNTRNLTSKNPVLDTVGKVINFGGQSLKAMDLVNSQIIKEMETTATLIRKQVQAKRLGDVASKKLSAQEKQDIYDKVLHYTMRQRLPSGVAALYKGLNTNFVTGLLFPFMRAQITLPRFTANRSPLAAGSVALNAARTIAGKEKLDTMQITRAVMGTTAMVQGWLQLKKNGVEIHGAARTPEERALRKSNKVPQGNYIKMKDGTVKRVDDLAPVSYVFAVYAAFDDAERRANEGQAKLDNYKQQALDAFSNIAQGSVFTGIREMSYAGEQMAKEVGDGGRSTYPGKNEGERLDRGAGSSWLDRKLVSVTTPGILREAQRKGWGQKASPEFRSPRDLGEEYKAALGFGLQKSVPEQLDIFGETSKRGETMDPLREIFGKGAATSDDPAIQLFDSLGWYPTSPAKTLDGLRVSQDKRMALLKQVGPDMHEELKALAEDRNFRQLPKEEQLEEVKQIVSEYMSEGMEDMRWSMEDQVDTMPENQRKDLRYNLKGRPISVLEKWGLD